MNAKKIKRLRIIGKVAQVTSSLIVPVGVGMVVGRVLSAYAPGPEVSILKKVGYRIGAGAIGGVAGSAAANYVVKQIEDVVESIETINAVKDLTEQMIQTIKNGSK